MAVAKVRKPKLRLMLVDASSGQEAANVPVRLWARFRAGSGPKSLSTRGVAGAPRAAATSEHDQFSDGGQPESRPVALGVLQSDHTGYVAFDLASLPDDGSIELLELEVLGSGQRRIDVTDAWSTAGTAALAAVSIAEGAKYAGKAGNLPAVVDPDADDWRLSPRSFGVQAVEIIGCGDCESMLQSRAPVQTLRFSQVLREPSEEPLSLLPAEPSSCEQDSEPSSRPPLCYREGVLVEYETTWEPIGHGLGEVLYSLPLAPCESVRLAILDWSRSDTTARTEDTGVAEALLHAQRRDRSIEEIVRGTVAEWQRGGTVMGAAGGTYNYGSGSIAASVGASYSTSAGDRNALSDGVQRISDAIAQATSNSRRLQSTVVVQASQREAESLQTRIVTNHNHCHALTVLYYEVVRHFVVRTAVRHLQDAILIRPHEQQFSQRRAARARALLEPILLDRTLLPAFDALARIDTPRVVETPPAFLETSNLVVKVTTGDEDTGTYDPESFVRFLLMVEDSSNPVRQFSLASRRVTSENWLYRVGRTNTFVVPIRVPLSSIRQVGISYHRPGNVALSWRMKGLEVQAFAEVRRASGTREELLPLYSNRDVDYRFTDGGEWWADAAAPASTAAAVSDGEAASRALVTRLVDHLNEFRHFYNRVLWMAEMPDQRAAWLEGYLFEVNGRRGRLIDFVENRIADVVGEYLVLPLGTTVLTRRNELEAPLPEERILSLPTRGAFAEAKLSNCNACEVIDETRFWDWQQSPCPCEAPEIAPTALGSRARGADASPSALPAPSVTVEGAPSAPDPNGVANMLELLGRSDLFRDMSGRAELAEVMKSVVNGAVQLSQEQMRQRTEQERIRQEAATEQQRIRAGQAARTPAAGAGGGSGSAQPGAAPAGGATTTPPTGAGAARGASPGAERNRSFHQALNAIDRAEQQGTYDHETAHARRRDVHDALVEGNVSSLALGAGAGFGAADEYAPLLVDNPESSSRRRVSYEPGERAEALRSPGLVTPLSHVERVLYDFGVNMPSETPTLKPEHETFVRDMVRELNLSGAEPRAQIELVQGYSDLVDDERVNQNLRMRRADAVAAALVRHGTPLHLIGRVRGARAGELLADNLTRESRALNRSVLMRIQPIARVRLPPERLQPAEHRSTRWSLGSLGGIVLGEVIQGTASLFELTDLALESRPSRYIWFAGPGLGVGGTIRRAQIPRLPGWRPGVSIDPFTSATPFRTTVPLRFEDFELAMATMLVAQAGFLIGYGIGWMQISGQLGGRRWTAISEEGSLTRDTSYLWIGGVQTANIGADIGGFVGALSYNRNISAAGATV